MSNPCPITGAGHNWGVLVQYERYVSRGQCDCGAVRFFANGIDKDILERAELLNSKKGKEGEQPGKRVALALATNEDNIIIEEEIMVTEKATEERAAAPPKLKGYKAIRAYYEENKEAILADYHTMKLIDFFKRWSMSSGIWQQLKERWEVEGKQKAKIVVKPFRTEASVESVSIHEAEHEELIWLRGYRQCVLDTLQNKC